MLQFQNENENRSCVSPKQPECSQHVCLLDSTTGLQFQPPLDSYGVGSVQRARSRAVSRLPSPPSIRYPTPISSSLCLVDDDEAWCLLALSPRPTMTPLESREMHTLSMSSLFRILLNHLSRFAFGAPSSHEPANIISLR